MAAHGLRGEHLLGSGDPSRITYSLLLYESTPGGDRECAHVDNLDAPFDLNSEMKLELGSTAKLRTLSRRLEDDFLASLDEGERAQLHALLRRLAEQHLPHCRRGAPETPLSVSGS